MPYILPASPLSPAVGSRLRERIFNYRSVLERCFCVWRLLRTTMSMNRESTRSGSCCRHRDISTPWSGIFWLPFGAQGPGQWQEKSQHPASATLSSTLSGRREGPATRIPHGIEVALARREPCWLRLKKGRHVNDDQRYDVTATTSGSSMSGPTLHQPGGASRSN